MLLLVAGTLSGLVPDEAVGKEWQRQSNEETPIRLHLDWDWLAAEKGAFAEKWTDDYAGHLFVGSWVRDPTHRFEILVQRLAPMHYWGRLPKLKRSNLEAWRFLSDTGMEKVQALGCGRGRCLSFEAGAFSCAGFLFAAGPLGSPNPGGSDPGGDMVTGYYCVKSGTASVAEELNRILEAITLIKD